jgi:hypothetical protein
MGDMCGVIAKPQTQHVHKQFFAISWVTATQIWALPPPLPRGLLLSGENEKSGAKKPFLYGNYDS